MIDEDNIDHVHPFARHAPQRLIGVHPRPVAREAEHLAPLRADGGAKCQRHPLPDRTPGQHHPVMRARTPGHHKARKAVGDAVIGHESALRHMPRNRGADRGGVESARRGVWNIERRHGRSFLRAECIGQRLKDRRTVAFRTAQHHRPAAFRHQQARLAGIGEEGHRHLRASHQHQVGAVQIGHRAFSKILHPVRREDTRAAHLARKERIRQHPDTCRAEAGCMAEPRPGKHRSIDENNRALCLPNGSRRRFDPLTDGRTQEGLAAPLAGFAAFIPGGVRRQQQRHRTRRRAEACRPGLRRQLAGIFRPICRFDPDRVGPGKAHDIGGERRIIAQMRHGVVADDIDHRRERPLGIVDVRPGIHETGAEVQQRHRRAPGDAGIAIGRPGRHALEQRQHRADARLPVERGNQVHLGSAGIGETGGHAMIGKRRDERLGAGQAGSGGIGHERTSREISCLLSGVP